ncbi:serine protease [Patescibacteria group bacterium]|nr:serine protease [Patescibacteria group bacterium]
MTTRGRLAIGSALLIFVLVVLFGSSETPVNPVTPNPFLELVAPTSSQPAAVITAPEPEIVVEPEAPVDNSRALALALGRLRTSLVNIICTTDNPKLHSVSGTGTLFDSRGLILTNAHIAQYFVLKDTLPKDDIECVIRTGSPARASYTASLAYISSSWLRAHPTTLREKMPRGTGEDDIAVLAITGSVSGDSLPSYFSFVPLSSKEPFLDQEVSIGSYAAQMLSSAQVTSSLYPTLVFGSIQDRYTFSDTDFDLMSLGGSAAAQNGSSGGAAVNTDAELIGLITTSSTQGTLFSRDLRAITAGHIRRSFSADTGTSFDSYFASQSPQTLVTRFGSQSEVLGAFLTQALGL